MNAHLIFTLNRMMQSLEELVTQSGQGFILV